MENNSKKNLLAETLENLEFSLKDMNLPEIVFLKNIPNTLHPKHYISLEFAEIYEADAVYFRYYDDNRYCVPQIYFYDNTLKNRSKEEIAEIHKKVYSSCQVPLISVINNSTITLYDCRKPVELKNGLISNAECEFTHASLDDLTSLKTYFSARELNYGFFWEANETSKSFLNNKSAYEKLVEVLTEIRNDFIAVFVQKGISKDFADDLLFKCILIKYLEENGKDGNNNYAEDFYNRNNIGFNSLNKILINGRLLNLLDSLEAHFNGDVFKIENAKERELLLTTDLTVLAEHLEGKLAKNKQIELWDIYSFKDIPIELISNFYEEFIPKTEENKGTVYTPSFLVNLLIDECLPLSNKKEDTIFDVKLIDVSCGSGIFITSAFKRLVQRWRIANGINGKPIEKQKIKIAEIKKILSKNIFGVDKNKTAVKLAKFSLQLALCQILPNNQLWNWSEEKVFDNLTDNVFENDFFDFLVEKKELHSTFDWVIGNPPFKKLDSIELLDIENKLAKSEIPLSPNINTKKQLALTFLEAIMHLTKKNTGKICQIIPSGELLYFQDSFTFRNYFFNAFNTAQIIDFTLLRRNLFVSKEDTTVSVIAVFAENKQPNENDILHITLRRTKKSKEKVYFELDYYDFFAVNKKDAIHNPFCWKSNLIGGNRVLDLVNKYYNPAQKTIKNYLDQCNIYTSKEKEQANILKIKKSILDGDFPHLQQYEKEAIILSAKDDKVLTDFYDSYLLNTEIKNINNFFIAATSGRQGLRGAYTIIDSDFYNLPYIQDVTKLTESEKIIINDVVDFSISEFGNGEKAPINKTIKDEAIVLDFANTYCDAINTIYKRNNKALRLKKIIEGKSFFACEFYYSTDNVNYQYTNSDMDIDTLLKQQVSTSLVYNKIIRLYANNNTITLIKPKKLRYWLKSIALRDADDTFDDILENGF
ncbi:MAG: hypothetical protein EAY66_00635 [Sphingobacteriales bacterium]|nr:MAG: hypothetical protein EAY66_00635 [Sphingobacteriales bacterium]